MLKTVSSITNAIGSLNFKGTWDANANSPALASSVGTKGDYYVVGTAGTTNLNGISNWGVGDWATYNGSVWQRVEGGADLNGVNLSVSGTSTLSGLTASTALALNASKEIVSVTNTGTGSNVLAASPLLSGNVLIGTSSASRETNGIRLISGSPDDAGLIITNERASGGAPLEINRQVSDGVLVAFYQEDTAEGTISVSGTTVSYNGGHLSRWAQTTGPKDDSLVKGTVLSNLDAMNQYVDVDGNIVENEQLNKVKVSDVQGDVDVAGVFVNWTHDDAHNVDEINMAMTGDMIIRIAQGVIVTRGDLLMSAGDGTAKPQGDDIIRSKTIAKVTSNHVTCTYEDGSYCVPCVLMAC
jgi:hypothetical protein